MARIAKESPLLVAVVLQVADAVVAGEGGLGDHEVEDAVEFLAA